MLRPRSASLHATTSNLSPNFKKRFARTPSKGRPSSARSGGRKFGKVDIQEQEASTQKVDNTFAQIKNQLVRHALFTVTVTGQSSFEVKLFMQTSHELSKLQRMFIVYLSKVTVPFLYLLSKQPYRLSFRKRTKNFSNVLTGYRKRSQNYSMHKRKHTSIYLHVQAVTTFEKPQSQHQFLILVQTSHKRRIQVNQHPMQRQSLSQFQH